MAYTRIKANYINVLPSAGGTRYWVAPLANNFDSSYWSTLPGGVPGASVPGPLNSVVFDNGGLGDCTFNIDATICNLRVDTGYTGTLDQSTNSTITGDASFLGGVFFNPNITVNRNLILSEGFLWRGSDSTIYAYGDVYSNNGFITDGMREIALIGSNSQNLHCAGGVLPTVYVNKASSNQIKVFGNSPIYINGDFRISDGTFNTNGHNLIMTSDTITPPTPNTLIGWWKGEDNAIDTINANNADWGVSTPSYAPGYIGKSFNLRGVDIELPDVPILDFGITSKFTVECYIYIQRSMASEETFGIKCESSTGTTLWTYLVKDSIAGQSWFYTPILAPYGLYITIPNYMADRWNKVKITHDNSTWMLYHNDVLVSTIMDTPMGEAENKNIYIGGFLTSSGSLVDEIQIYNSVV